MQKQAEYTHPAGMLVPGARFFGLNPDPAPYPDITGNPEANQMVWNTLLSTASLTALLGTATYIAHKITTRSWDKAKAEIHRNKVNALHSYNTPNTAKAVGAVNQVRNLGLGNKVPKLLENKAVDASTEEMLDAEKKEEAVKKSASGLLPSLIPPLIAIPAAVSLNGLIKDELADSRGEELDAEITKQRNKLDALYARLFELYGKDADKMMPKAASGEDLQPTRPVDEPNIITNGAQLFLGIPILAGILSAYATYNFAQKQDEDFAKAKMLKRTVLPQNLTNTPAEVQLVLGKGGKIPKKYSEQDYAHK